MQVAEDIYQASPTDSGGSDLGSRTREAVREDPRVILALAALVAKGRGRWPDRAITRACAEEVDLLRQVDGADLIDGLGWSLVERDVDSALQWLLEVGVIEMFLPELDATKDLKQEPGRHHKDVWEHTKLVVKQAVPRPAVRWAALLHDIGKVPTRTFTQRGVHFHGHAEVGARMFDKISRRLPFDNPLRRKIRFLIKYHLRSAQYEPDWTDSAVRRFAREMEEHLVDLLDLSRADITSKRPGRRQFLLKQISTLSDRIDNLRAEDAVVPPLPKGVGTAIMERFSLPPSRRIGEIKELLEAAVERGDIEPHKDEAYYVDWLEAGDHVAPDGD